MNCAVDPCFSMLCHENATCVVGKSLLLKCQKSVSNFLNTSAEDQVARCMCKSGFVGSGEECEAEVCGMECSSEGVSCVLREGRPICASMDIQELQNLVTALALASLLEWST